MKLTTLKISLALLIKNEIFGLKNLFPRIPLTNIHEVFAVDANSDDGSIEFLKNRNVEVYTQKQKGRGEAFKLAFQVSQADAIIFFSPDGNEDPKDILKFRSLLEQGYDMVIATRMIKGAHNEEDDKLLKWRKWANNVFNLMANLTWNRGPFVSDSINGFRAITKDAWLKLHPDASGYSIEYQTTIRAFKKGLRIAEFPTFEDVPIDKNKKGSPSIKTGLVFLKTYFSELFHKDMPSKS